MEPQSSGDPVSCAPRQRALGSNRGAARPPRAPPGRFESQLEPPASWARRWGASAAAEQLAAEPILAALEPPSVSSVLGQRCVLCPGMGMYPLQGHVATHRYAVLRLSWCCVVAGLPQNSRTASRPAIGPQSLPPEQLRAAPLPCAQSSVIKRW
jgi:hypothetical protein